MKNMSIKQWIGLGLILLSLILMIFSAPFGMKVMKDASAFQKEISSRQQISKPLLSVMDELKDAQEHGIPEETNETYAALLREASAGFDSASVGTFRFRLILFLVGIVLLLAGFVLAGKVRLLVLILGAVIMVFPFYWMITSSLKTPFEMNLFPPSLVPENWLNVSNYASAWEKAPFATYFINSIVVCMSSVALVMFTTILAAYAFSRLQFPGRDALFTLLLSMMMVPFELLVITNYQTTVRLNLYDSIPALILPFTSSIFYTYILRNFFMSVPDSLYYSAQVDGSSNWQYLWKVMVPIAMPSMVTILLLNAMASWNSFMWPKLIISTDRVRTLPWALVTFTTEAGSHDELIMAAATMVVLPMLILFLFARKQIVRGVARGGIKG